MNGIAPLGEGKSLYGTYVAPECTTMELNCEGSFLITSMGGLYNVGHDGYVGEDYTGGWDN